jgi:branched-chain amino acid aminotransferase
MDKLRLSYFMLNNMETEGNELPDFPGATIVYEVIRLSNGVFLFLDDHIDRIIASAELKNLSSTPQKCELFNILKKTVEINKEQNGNVKLLVAFSGKTCSLTAGFIHHSYPTASDYKSGVHVASMVAERTDPNAKIINPLLKQKVDKVLADKSIYEVAYVNSQGIITEGSRSNLFFIKGKQLFTAPENLVLKGVTRKYVIEACKKAGLELVEEAVSLQKSTEMDALLITGTSPKVLPVSSLDDHSYNTQIEVIEKIIIEYQKIFDNYIQSNLKQLA